MHAAFRTCVGCCCAVASDHHYRQLLRTQNHPPRFSLNSFYYPCPQPNGSGPRIEQFFLIAHAPIRAPFELITIEIVSAHHHCTSFDRYLRLRYAQLAKSTLIIAPGGYAANALRAVCVVGLPTPSTPWEWSNRNSQASFGVD